MYDAGLDHQGCLAMKANMQVLVVDDFSTTRRIIGNLLRQIGIEHIYEARDGQEALDVLDETHIDLVVTDWHMPIMDGLELVVTIREQQDIAHIPILMVTAESKKEQMMMAAQAGVNGYIVKPFNAETLQAKILRIAERLAMDHLLPAH